MKALTLVSTLLATAYAVPVADVLTAESTEISPAGIQDTAVIPLDDPLMRSTIQGEKVLPRMSQSK
jgi:hypothetical protein